MKLQVLSYNSELDFYTCRDSRGKIHKVDLLIDGGIQVEDPYELVGRKVECEKLVPYIEIAMFVRLVERKEQ